ncbi:hypothetical protein C8J57DRAFT_1508901 [Mycena rebaudengoi]|nr:hypothetical protein C8J57DRAFT_1508901 [Mycena rebaudengoi]
MPPRARLPVDASYIAATRTFYLFRSALPLARSVYSCFAPIRSLWLPFPTCARESFQFSFSLATRGLVPFPLQRTACTIPAYSARSVLTRASLRNSARCAIFSIVLPSCLCRPSEVAVRTSCAHAVFRVVPPACRLSNGIARMPPFVPEVMLACPEIMRRHTCPVELCAHALPLAPFSLAVLAQHAVLDVRTQHPGRSRARVW